MKNSGTWFQIPCMAKDWAPEILNYPACQITRELCKSLPRSQTAIVHTFRMHLEGEHDLWEQSPESRTFRKIDPSSRAYWKLSRAFPRKLLSILTQLRRGHIPLQKHLNRICPPILAISKQCTTIWSAHMVPRERLRRKLEPRNSIHCIAHDGRNPRRLVSVCERDEKVQSHRW